MNPLATLAALLLACSCPAMDWEALHEVEGSPKTSQVGVTGDLGWLQISPAVWKQFSKPNERWWVKSDNLAVGKRVMDYRIKQSLGHRPARSSDFSPFQEALLWHCPAHLSHPRPDEADYAQRYANLCENQH